MLVVWVVVFWLVVEIGWRMFFVRCCWGGGCREMFLDWCFVGLFVFVKVLVSGSGWVYMCVLFVILWLFVCCVVLWCCSGWVSWVCVWLWWNVVCVWVCGWFSGLFMLVCVSGCVWCLGWLFLVFGVVCWCGWVYWLFCGWCLMWCVCCFWSVGVWLDGCWWRLLLIGGWLLLGYDWFLVLIVWCCWNVLLELVEWWLVIGWCGWW